MLKQEFEQLISKKVSYDTYLIYENMYSSTNLSKQQFINLLNVNAIPEDPEIVNLRNAYNEDIAYADTQIEYHSNCMESWEGLTREDEFARCEHLYHKNQIIYYRKLKKYYKSQIKSLTVF